MTLETSLLMEPTQQPPTSSVDSPASDDSSLNLNLPVDYLEAPLASLLDKELGSMTPQEIQSMLTQLKILNQKPGELTRRLKDESVAIATGAQRVRQNKDAKKKAVLASVI